MNKHWKFSWHSSSSAVFTHDVFTHTHSHIHSAHEHTCKFNKNSYFLASLFYHPRQPSTSTTTMCDVKKTSTAINCLYSKTLGFIYNVRRFSSVRRSYARLIREYWSYKDDYSVKKQLIHCSSSSSFSKTPQRMFQTLKTNSRPTSTLGEHQHTFFLSSFFFALSYSLVEMMMHILRACHWQVFVDSHLYITAKECARKHRCGGALQSYASEIHNEWTATPTNYSRLGNFQAKIKATATTNAAITAQSNREWPSYS